MRDPAARRSGGQYTPAGPDAEGMSPEAALGDRPPPPDPEAPSTGVVDEQQDPPEPNEPA
jgi:hypothetical protein